jgi:hypothetical protein
MDDLGQIGAAQDILRVKCAGFCAALWSDT